MYICYVYLLCVSVKVVEEKSFSFDTRYSGVCNPSTQNIGGLGIEG